MKSFLELVMLWIIILPPAIICILVGKYELIPMYWAYGLVVLLFCLITFLWVKEKIKKVKECNI